MEKISKKITEIKNFLKTCETYCEEEAQMNDELKTFKEAIKFLKERVDEIEKITTSHP
ncbi:hypothetical protein IJD34_01005 [bacterium]|nr:hypothetical protein [bacterium]